MSLRMSLCVSACVASKIKITTVIKNAFILVLRRNHKIEQVPCPKSEGF